MAHQWTRDELQKLLDLRREHRTLIQCADALGRTFPEVAGVLAAADLTDSIHREARARDCMGCGDLMLSNSFGNRFCFWCRQSMSETTIFSHPQRGAKRRSAE